jgi:hypothetical protein
MAICASQGTEEGYYVGSQEPGAVELFNQEISATDTLSNETFVHSFF